MPLPPKALVDFVTKLGYRSAGSRPWRYEGRAKRGTEHWNYCGCKIRKYIEPDVPIPKALIYDETLWPVVVLEWLDGMNYAFGKCQSCGKYNWMTT